MYGIVMGDMGDVPGIVMGDGFGIVIGDVRV